ncbi:MAG TPA: tRNA (N(6)-L-threonylcarbamoyladenosine(37)-C(2))-methylthiotransferase MtaB [Bacteroidetes bacterium]|nr:tRNA (N(6)-L-threonylcarbamoyladenosine(37)-C(2))-methylthiotransferase MtaB [Bacteroidota bacterium]
MVRRAIRTSGNPFVVVTGCYAQLEPAEVASIKGVDLVLGTKEKFDIFDHVGGLEKKLYPQVFVSGIETVDNFGVSYTTAVGDRTRAFLKVQDGCDYNCSFCTIPLARGASRSQTIEASVTQAQELVLHGFKEITLTGVNVGDYGKNTNANLLQLLHELVTVDGLERVRISSIEPNLLSDEMIAFVATQPKMCKHFHIPLQSGCDEILRLMRRRYTTTFYADLIHHIRGLIPECGIGVDVITGFPGETEAHFKAALQFIEGLPVSYLHVFTYSERPNTPAAGFGNQIEPKARFKRNEILREIGLKKKRSFYLSHIGRRVPVLTESDVEGGVRFGFTDNYVRVGLPASLVGANEIVAVEITGVEFDKCMGRIVKEKAAA